MSRTRNTLHAIAASAAILIAPNASGATGTAFTYQGHLTQSSAPVNIDCDFEFTLWDTLNGGNQVGFPILQTVVVDNGRFTTELDFGTDIFKGDRRWLEISVCCPAPCSNYTTLTPRQEVTPAPYALALPGLFTQQVAVPNLVGGDSANSITNSAIGSSIGGGTGHTLSDDMNVIAGGENNQTGNNNADPTDAIGTTVPGGTDNTAAGDHSFAAGQRAKANHSGTFVWADPTDTDFASTGDDQFLVRASGGVGINNNNPGAALHVGGTAGVDGIMFPDGTLQTTAATDSGGTTTRRIFIPAEALFYSDSLGSTSSTSTKGGHVCLRVVPWDNGSTDHRLSYAKATVQLPPDLSGTTITYGLLLMADVSEQMRLYTWSKAHPITEIVPGWNVRNAVSAGTATVGPDDVTAMGQTVASAEITPDGLFSISCELRQIDAGNVIHVLGAYIEYTAAQ